jgi:hypothetical protein
MPATMAKRKFKVGDKVLVTGEPDFGYPPRFRDDIGTKKLLKSMVGKVFTIRGFDEYGNVELRPRRLNFVWLEPQFLKLRARKREKGGPS